MKFILIILLFPLMLVYGCVVEIRYLLYRLGWFKVSKTPVFSIGVGNITVGGTGKTPHIEYFIRKFQTSHSLATLSRGYGRKTKGFLSVNATMSAETVGDEPWQFFLKFGKKVVVNVGEKRAPAAQKIHQLFPQVNLLLMDDVFQHRAVEPDFSILLCDYNRPFFNDYPFPVGRLREFRKGAQRADQIIVSKCPAKMPLEERKSFVQQLAKYAKGVPVAFSTFSYSEVVPVFSSGYLPSKWLLVTGIARPEPLVRHLISENSLIEHLQYADHHYFSHAEALHIVDTYSRIKSADTGILITEKDFARLNSATKELWKNLPLFYIPITVEFIEGEEILLQNINLAMKGKSSAFRLND